MGIVQFANAEYIFKTDTKIYTNPSSVLYIVNECIQNALLEEVYTTPKPGLVDCHDTGSHNDMDVSTFEISARTIAPYLTKMFETGLQWKGQLTELFFSVRSIGMAAETAMFRATGGVNTHKGAIFTIGILASAAGYQYGKDGTFLSDGILNLSGEMTAEVLEQDFQKMKKRNPVSHGEILFKKYGERGIRGEAMGGYPILRDMAMPWIRRYRAFETSRKSDKMVTQNVGNINVLLHIMTRLSDTNVLIRSSRHQMLWLQQEAKEILSLGGAFSIQGLQKICQLNKKCIQSDISPGGAADMLAAAIFLWNLEQIEKKDLLYGRVY